MVYGIFSSHDVIVGESVLCGACAHGKHEDHDYSAAGEPCICKRCSS